MKRSTICVSIGVILLCTACGRPDLKDLKEGITGSLRDSLHDVAGALTSQIRGFKDSPDTAKAQVLQMLSQVGQHLTDAQRGPAVSILSALRSKIGSLSESNGTELARLYSSWEQALGRSDSSTLQALRAPSSSKLLSVVQSQVTELRRRWSSTPVSPPAPTPAPPPVSRPACPIGTTPLLHFFHFTGTDGDSLQWHSYSESTVPPIAADKTSYTDGKAFVCLPVAGYGTSLNTLYYLYSPFPQYHDQRLFSTDAAAVQRLVSGYGLVVATAYYTYTSQVPGSVGLSLCSEPWRATRYLSTQNCAEVTGYGFKYEASLGYVMLPRN